MEELLIALLCLAVIALAVKLNRLDSDGTQLAELRDLIHRLEQRLGGLERQFHSQAAPRAATPAEPPPASVPLPPASVHEPPRTQPPVMPAPVVPVPVLRVDAPAPPPPQPVRQPLVYGSVPIAAPRPTVASQPPAPGRSLEERLGQNWLSKIGIALVVLGVASFLGYQLAHLGPLGKSLTGLATALFLLGGGLWLERRPNYRIFARAGIGGGWALLFFVTFALYHVDAMRVLASQSLDLVLMLAVAAAMVWHSLRYKSQSVTALAFLLAFATVGISHVTVFSLVAGALLAAALVTVAAREHWYELGLAGLCGVYGNHFLWLYRVLPDGGQPGHPFPELLPSAGLLLLYWLIFRAFYILRVPRDSHQQRIASLTAILNSAGLLALLKYQSAHPEWAFWGLLALGTVEFALAFLARTRWRGAFLVLSTLASALLLAAVPFRFAGSSWTLLWLLEAEALFVAGIRIRENVLRRLGLIAGFVAAIQILLADLPEIFALRQHSVDLSRHPSIAIALLTSALLFWFNAEFARRRWAALFETDSNAFDHAALTITSYLAAITMAGALWLFFPESWTIVAWLAAGLAISFATDRLGTTDKLRSSDLAAQADVLAAAAVLRILVVNFGDTTHLGGFSLRAITVTIASALLYLGVFRRTRGVQLPDTEYIAPCYSWAASLLLATLFWFELQPVAIAVAWGALGLGLFEAGTVLRRSYLRYQSYVLFAASFVRVFLWDLNLWQGAVGPSGPQRVNHHVYTVLPLIAGYIWVYHRTQTALAESEFDRAAGVLAAWLGTATATALLDLELRPEFVALGWAALALVLIAAAWALRRPLFTAQALALLAASAARALLFNLFLPATVAGSFWHTRAATIGAACAAMLLCLPAAFAIRRASEEDRSDSGWNPLLLHPEQPFFFVPYTLLAVLIAFELRTGMITLGWIALGLAAILAALPVGERSYRLGGLGLLLLGLGKIVLVDIWSASPTDRYLTLILTGVALLLVSFLYSRYRETILKLL
jgi:uncharacterized membrane protein